MERRASQVVRRNSENWLASQNSAITQPFDMKNMKFKRRPVNMIYIIVNLNRKILVGATIMVDDAFGSQVGHTVGPKKRKTKPHQHEQEKPGIHQTNMSIGIT